MRTIQTLENTNTGAVKYKAESRVPVYLQQHTVLRNTLKKKVDQFSGWENMMKVDNKNAVKIKNELLDEFKDDPKICKSLRRSDSTSILQCLYHMIKTPNETLKKKSEKIKKNHRTW